MHSKGQILGQEFKTVSSDSSSEIAEWLLVSHFNLLGGGYKIIIPIPCLPAMNGLTVNVIKHEECPQNSRTVFPKSHVFSLWFQILSIIGTEFLNDSRYTSWRTWKHVLKQRRQTLRVSREASQRGNRVRVLRTRQKVMMKHEAELGMDD